MRDFEREEHPAKQILSKFGSGLFSGGFKYKLGISLLLIIMIPFVVGRNTAGERTVIEYPNGKLSVKFSAGVYPKLFGSTKSYNNVLTLDFDREENEESATLDQNGIGVLYQDGGTGTVYGKVRFKLPDDEATMLNLHKDFRSPEGLAHKLIKGATEEVMNSTASLMNSEDSYATLRGTYSKWARYQLEHGIFKTETEQIITTEDSSKQFCVDLNFQDLSEEQRQECRKVRRIKKTVPIITYKEGTKQPLTEASDLGVYGITISGFNMLQPAYEPSTMTQISEKRKQTMLIITSKANAERAKQDALTSESQGIANVVKAKYAEEVIKEKAIVVAEREKQVAEIKAQQLVEVARQGKLQAEQNKLAAGEIKLEQIALGEGESERKRLVMQADGALEQKLSAYRDVNYRYADAMGKHRLVPDIQFGGSNGQTGQTGSQVQDLMNLMMVNSAKQISLDMSLPAPVK
jgi:hypothetical protein